MLDPLERRVKLLMFLLESRPLTRRLIMERSGLYLGEGDAPRAMFERDKRELRRLGVPIRAEISEGDEGATRYTINRDEYELPDLNLAPDEQFALSVAAAAVHLGTNWDEQAMQKLGGASSLSPSILAEVPALPHLPLLYSAVRDHAVVSFEYSDKEREVEPQGLFFRAGHWYLDALDSDIRKTFRVDRISGNVKARTANAFEPLAVGTAEKYQQWDPLQAGDGQGFEAIIWIDAQSAAQTRRHRGVTVSSENDDGSIVLSVRGLNREALRAWVLTLRDHAEILGPPELRKDMSDWLLSIVEGK